MATAKGRLQQRHRELFINEKGCFPDLPLEKMFQEDDIFGVPSPRVDGVYKIASKLTWQISTIVVREAIVRLEEVLKVFLIAISLVLLLLHYCH